jgi:hypothetical protein
VTQLPEAGLTVLREGGGEDGMAERDGYLMQI